MRETLEFRLGYKVHLIADTAYKLPVAFTVVSANDCEVPVVHRRLDGLAGRNGAILQTCEIWSGDRG
ncbi:MAG: hypothetical protein ACLFSP_09920 [Spirochaetaceae bacterium]